MFKILPPSYQSSSWLSIFALVSNILYRARYNGGNDYEGRSNFPSIEDIFFPPLFSSFFSLSTCYLLSLLLFNLLPPLLLMNTRHKNTISQSTQLSLFRTGYPETNFQFSFLFPQLFMLLGCLILTWERSLTIHLSLTLFSLSLTRLAISILLDHHYPNGNKFRNSLCSSLIAFTPPLLVHIITSKIIT